MPPPLADQQQLILHLLTFLINNMPCLFLQRHSRFFQVKRKVQHVKLIIARLRHPLEVLFVLRQVQCQIPNGIMGCE